MPYRVAQWTTGHIGRAAVKGILGHPDLELVGAYAWSKSKDGVDVGELCGIEPLGVVATADIDTLLSWEPDCVSYMPRRLDVDDMVALLEAGVNVVSSYFVNGNMLGDGVRQRLEDAAQRGGASLFGSGIFPGWANFIAPLTATATSGFERLRFLESVDLTYYEAIANFAQHGWASPPDDEKWTPINRVHLGQYSESVEVMAEMLHVPLREVVFEYESAVTPEDRTIHGFTMPAGTVAGQKCTWKGMVDDEAVIQLEVVWNAGAGLEPEWPLHHGYTMEVTGQPNLHTRMRFSPSPEQLASGRVADLAQPVTAMPCVNAIPVVCDAAPGIRTFADLPLITARYTPRG